jgi:hypothetical protein
MLFPSWHRIAAPVRFTWRHAFMGSRRLSHVARVTATHPATEETARRSAVADFKIAARAEDGPEAGSAAPRAGFIRNIRRRHPPPVCVASVLAKVKRFRYLDHWPTPKTTVRAHHIASRIGPVMHGADARQIDRLTRLRRGNDYCPLNRKPGLNPTRPQEGKRRFYCAPVVRHGRRRLHQFSANPLHQFARHIRTTPARNARPPFLTLQAAPWLST